MGGSLYIRLAGIKILVMVLSKGNVSQVMTQTMRVKLEAMKMIMMIMTAITNPTVGRLLELMEQTNKNLCHAYSK